MLTLSKIAKLANVSVSTASKAFSMNPEVSEQTRSIIFDIARENGCFKKFFNAKYPRLVIAVICPEFESLYYTTMLARLQISLEKMGCEICVATTQFSQERGRELIEYYSRYAPVDGIAVIDGSSFADAECDVPKIHIGTASADDVCITTTSTEAIEEAVNHLVDSGITDIGFLGERLTRAKQTTVCNAITKKLGSYNEDYICVGERFFDGGYDAVKKMIDSGRLPRALICAYDYLAIGAINCLVDNGYRVPDDVAVIGMDDIPVAKYLNPPLSSIDANIDKVCDAASTTLINMLMGKPHQKCTVIPATLHLRHSSEMRSKK